VRSPDSVRRHLAQIGRELVRQFDVASPVDGGSGDGCRVGGGRVGGELAGGRSAGDS
jgi:hypothetical protein